MIVLSSLLSWLTQGCALRISIVSRQSWSCPQHFGQNGERKNEPRKSGIAMPKRSFCACVRLTDDKVRRRNVASTHYLLPRKSTPFFLKFRQPDVRIVVPAIMKGHVTPRRIVHIKEVCHVALVRVSQLPALVVVKVMTYRLVF